MRELAHGGLAVLLVLAAACGARHEPEPVGGDGGVEPFDCSLCGPWETCDVTDRTCEPLCGSFDCPCSTTSVTCDDGTTYTRCESYWLGDGCVTGSGCRESVVRECAAGCAAAEGLGAICADDPEECRGWPEARPEITVAVPGRDPAGCEGLSRVQREVVVAATGPIVARSEERFSVEDPDLGEVAVFHDLPASATGALEVGREVELVARFRWDEDRDCLVALVVSDDEAPILVVHDGGTDLDFGVPVPLSVELADVGCPRWPGLCSEEGTSGLSVALGEADPVVVREGRPERVDALGRTYEVHDLRSFVRSGSVTLVDDCYSSDPIPEVGLLISEAR